MVAIEADNPSLKSVLPKEYARPGLDKEPLGSLIKLVSDIEVASDAAKSQDVLGRVYEYFLAQFASAEGKKGGQFYTPQHVVQLLVEMLAPFEGRVYDPCCGSRGMFVQSEKFVEAHGGNVGKTQHLRAGIELHDLAAGGDEPPMLRSRGRRSPFRSSQSTSTYICCVARKPFLRRTCTTTLSQTNAERKCDAKVTGVCDPRPEFGRRPLAKHPRSRRFGPSRI